MPESALAALRLVERIHYIKLRADHRRDDELCDPVASLNRLRLGTPVYHNDAKLTPVVAVHRARRVRHPQPAVQRQPTPRPHLALISRWNSNADAGRNERAPTGRQRERLI